MGNVSNTLDFNCNRFGKDSRILNQRRVLIFPYRLWVKLRDLATRTRAPVTFNRNCSILRLTPYSVIALSSDIPRGQYEELPPRKLREVFTESGCVTVSGRAYCELERTKAELAERGLMVNW